MGIGAGLIVSETSPAITGYGTYVWYKPSTREYFKAVNGSWILDTTEPLPTELGDINFTGSISVAGDTGITGSKTLGGYRITFKKGLLTGFDPV